MSPLSLATDTAVRTHCPYCAFQCGIRLSNDGPGWAVAGDSSFPVNNGQLCIKGWTSSDLLDHPDRLTHPLMRTASGTLAPAPWGEALDFVADGFRRTRERYGPAAVGLFGSGALTNEKA